MAALLAGIPDFNTDGGLLRDLPLPDAADQEIGMTTAEAVEVSLNTTLLTPVYPDIEHDLIHPCYITRVKIYVLI